MNLLHLRMAGLAKPDEDDLDQVLWKPLQKEDKVCEVIFLEVLHGMSTLCKRMSSRRGAIALNPKAGST